MGLTLGDWFRMRDAQAEDTATAEPKAKSVIFIYMAGGISHLDTFDPKPYAPIEIRGELGTVKTNTGEVFSGTMPKLAQVADKMTVIRSMNHGEAAHERGTHNMLTGYRPSPAIVFPSMGAVVSRKLGSRNDLPPYMSVPGMGSPFSGPGYLSASYGPFTVGGDPNSDGFNVRDLNLPAGVSPERMERRKGLLSAVDQHFASLEQTDILGAMDSYYQKAYALISSQAAREAFNIAAEPAEMRDSYGRNTFGQRLLLARRVVEAGGRFVTVNGGGWDYHQKIKQAMEGSMPPVDQGIAALITDLDQRGLLDSTMVVMSTEFGRTTGINKDGGRDHWPKGFSVMLAGGGMQRGLIHGRTDDRGSEPAEDGVGPEDLAATIYSQMGIDPTEKLMSAGDRPIDIVRHGEVISKIV
jgi:hypothetical protein